jgi:opacity protein-like surface antigen
MICIHLAVARMSGFSSKIALAAVLAALCLGGSPAHAQGTSVPYYWASGWSSGFGGNLSAGQGANANGESAGFANNAAGPGAFMQRYNFSSSSFLGNERALGAGLSGLNQTAAFGSSYSYDGVQVGYNFANSPVSIFAGFDTAKYNPGLGSNPFSPFDTSSNATPGYTARAGVEFRPTSNLSLSLGASFTQQGTDSSSLVLPGASPFAVGGHR